MTQRTTNILSVLKGGNFPPALVTARRLRLLQGNRKARKQARRQHRNHR